MDEENRLKLQSRPASAKRILEPLREGFGYREGAREEKLSERCVHQIVSPWGTWGALTRPAQKKTAIPRPRIAITCWQSWIFRRKTPKYSETFGNFWKTLQKHLEIIGNLPKHIEAPGLDPHKVAQP